MSKKLLILIFSLISACGIGVATTTILNSTNLINNYYTQEDLDSKIEEIESYIQTTDEELRNSINSLTSQYENKVKEIEEQIQSNKNKISSLTNSYNEKVAELEAQDTATTEALNSLKASYEESLEKLQACDQENKDAIQALTITYNEKVAELEAQDTATTEALNSLKASYEENLEKLQASDRENEAAIDALTNSYNEKVAELEAQDTATTEALNSLKASYEESLEKLQASDQENKAAIQALTNSYNEKVAELESQDAANEDKINTLYNEFEEKVLDLENKNSLLNNLIETLNDELDTKINEINSKYDTKIEEINSVLSILSEKDEEMLTSISDLIAKVDSLMNVPKYTVSFDTDGAGTIDNQVIQKGDKVTSPLAPTKEGYIFDGWYYGDEKWSFIGYTISEDITLKAKWHESYVLPEIVFEDQAYEYDGVMKSLKISNENDLPEGLFVMYSNNSRKEVGNTLASAYIMDDTGYVYETLTAVLTIEKATISFTIDDFTTSYDGEVHEVSINEELPYGVSVSYENNYQRNAGSYEVIAKFTVSDNYNEVEDIKANLVITKLTPTVTVTHNSENFTLLDEINFTVDSAISGTVTLKEGQTLTLGTKSYKYIFTPHDNVNYNTVIGNVNITVYSKVTFVDLDDEILDIQYIEKGGYIDNFVPVYENESGYYYKFNGWLFQNGYFDEYIEVHTSITLKADYEKLPISYTITYNLNDGLSNETLVQNYTILDEVVIPELSKTGYEFIGWSGTQLESLNKTVILNEAFGDREYTANFIPNSYTLTFELDGGSCDTTELKVNFDDEVILPIPRLFGYDFDGWTLEGTPIENSFQWNYLNDINLVATWSQADIVEIRTVEELTYVAYSLDGNYILMENIDLSGISWDVIGDASTPFTGIFNGNGYTISNLSLSAITNYSGLFGANSGTIKNLNLVDANIDAGAIGASILVGKNSGIIDNCSVSGIIDFKSEYSGGICAYNTGTISNSNSSATVLNSKYIGGLVGYTYGGTIETSSATGNVNNSLTESYMGGLIGYADASVNAFNITNSNSTATVSYEYLEDATVVTSYVGGLVGYASCGELTEINGYINNSHYNGEINVIIDSTQTDNSISFTSYVGGLVGSSSYIKYDKCFSSGKLNNTVLKDNYSPNRATTSARNYVNSYIGGLIGADQSGECNYIYSNIEIVNYTYVTNFYHSYYYYSYSYGYTIDYVCSAYAYSYVGGLIGQSYLSVISEAYSASSINSSTISSANYESADDYWRRNRAYSYSYVGGLIGNTKSSNTTINNSYASNVSFTAIAEAEGYDSSYITIVNNYGGLVGQQNETINNCYRYSGIDSNIELGTPTSLANLKSVNFITNNLGWDTEVWLLENGEYPTLK